METCFDDSERYIIQLNNLTGNSIISSGKSNLIDRKMLRCSEGITITIDMIME